MRRILAVLLFLLVLVPSGVNATTVRYLDLESLVQSSALIFHATVGEVVEQNLGTLDRPRLVTDVTFTVHRVLKGANPGAQFHLRLVGGSAEGYTLAIPGQPSFRKGDEVVLFLESTGVEYVVNGMGQGRYAVTSGDDGRKLARRDLSGMSVVRNLQNPGKLERGELEEPLLLEDLFRRIHETRER